MPANQIPGEVPGWRDLIGTYVQTARFGPVRFGKFEARAYEKAAAIQEPWPDGLLVVGAGCGGLPPVGHPLTLDLLKKAKAKLKKLTGQDGAFTTNGFYRPPGTPWGIGRFADPKGVIDSTDPLGHWYMALDLGRKSSAASFGVDVDKLLEVLASVGIVRPMDYGVDGFEKEPWHFRPNQAARERWAAKCATSYS